MRDIQRLEQEAGKFLRYDKDVASKVERLACTRPERLNAVTAGVRQVNADLVFRADIDVVIAAERQQRCRRVICNRKKR